MRFDDSLRTILAADMASAVGAQSAWRQLVDLAGRGRIAADDIVLARLRALRPAVPVEVRAASGRALAFATPGPALVGIFAEDVLSVAAPVLRTAILPAAAWLRILPRMGPEGRSVLRHRRDLPGEVMRGLDSFGATDFVLPSAGPPATPPHEPAPVPVAPATPPADTPRGETPFVTLGQVAQGLPIVAEALRRAEPRAATAPDAAGEAERFEIADLVARIDAFQRDRGFGDVAPAAPAPPTSFRFETDAAGTIRLVEGVARGAIVGASIAQAACQGQVDIEPAIGGAFHDRSGFVDARIDIAGRSDAAGSWRASGAPVFTPGGTFAGYRGIARRPRPAEDAGPGARRAVSDSLRQLVHELRTPTNAIAGFAELIEAQLLGPVAPVYRDHATTIRDQAASLVAAIDDLDTAARIEGGALDLSPEPVPLDALLARVAAELEPLAASRRAVVRIETFAATVVHADKRALERLLSRLVATLVAAARPGELIAIGATAAAPGTVGLRLSRPRGLAVGGGEALLSIDADQDQGGASLLGTGFALRLARNLAAEIGGALTIASDRLTLQLPARVTDPMERASQ